MQATTSFRSSRLAPWTAVVLAFAVVVAMAGQADAQVTFADPNLEVALRDALNKPTGAITDADLAGLTELDARERGISDLSDGYQSSRSLLREGMP